MEAVAVIVIVVLYVACMVLWGWGGFQSDMRQRAEARCDHLAAERDVIAAELASLRGGMYDLLNGEPDESDGDE